MKQLAKLTAMLGVALTLATGPAPVKAQETIRLGVSFFPFHSADSQMPDLLAAIAPALDQKGYTINKTVFLNYAEANPALAHREIDGNLIQHQPYMEIFNARSGAELVLAQPVYHATFALYSGKYSNLDAIPVAETVYIPNDGVNTARALLLLEAVGLISLADGVTHAATIDDITDNPRNLNLVPLPLSATAGAYDEAGRTLAVMYPTFARALELEGNAERLYVEERNSLTDVYAVSFVVRKEDADNAKTRAVAEALKSDAAAQYLRDNYGWASTPAR